MDSTHSDPSRGTIGCQNRGDIPAMGLIRIFHEQYGSYRCHREVPRRGTASNSPAFFLPLQSSGGRHWRRICRTSFIEGRISGNVLVQIRPSLNRVIISSKLRGFLISSSRASAIGFPSLYCCHAHSARLVCSSPQFGSLPVVSSNSTTPKL